MKKWEAARYFIDAKKCVDSVWYIAENGKLISNINLRKKVDELLRAFYINCCVVLDETHNKKALCQADATIKRIYYERDKDKAHKDADYKPIKYSSLFELRDIMKDQLLTVYNNCGSVLPDNITLDYVPHDKELFRLAHSITPENEERIKAEKYPLYKKANYDINDPRTELRTVFQDTEDLRNIPADKINEYAVVLEAGINYYEMVQEMQDGIIKLNVLFNQNMWASVKQDTIEWIMKLSDLGIIDAFGLPTPPDPNNPEAMAEFNRLIQGENRFDT